MGWGEGRALYLTPSTVFAGTALYRGQSHINEVGMCVVKVG